VSDNVSPLTDDTPEERRARAEHCICQCFRLTPGSGGVALAGNQVHTPERCGFFERLSVAWSADGKDSTVSIAWRPA
jgi:hypothetical protein